jgi:hypothetical protein
VVSPILGLGFYGTPLFVAITVGTNGCVVAMNRSHTDRSDMDLRGIDLSKDSLLVWPLEPSTSAEEALVEELAEEALALIEPEVLVGSEAPVEEEALFTIKATSESPPEEPSVGEPSQEICAEAPPAEVASAEEVPVEAPAVEEATLGQKLQKLLLSKKPSVKQQLKLQLFIGRWHPRSKRTLMKFQQTPQ